MAIFLFCVSYPQITAAIATDWSVEAESIMADATGFMALFFYYDSKIVFRSKFQMPK